MIQRVLVAMALPASALAAAEGHGEETLSEVILHHISNAPLGVPALDQLGLSKAALLMMLSTVMLFAVTGWGLRRSRLQGAPKGLTNALEAMVIYMRDKVAVATMGDRWGKRFTPFLCTLFFFILSCNLIGMLPGSYTATSNLNVTAALALISLLLIVVCGLIALGPIGYVKHMIPPATPTALVPMVIMIELLSLIIKPVALTIRLAANMTAGHIVIIVMLSFIFVFKSFWLAPFSVPLAVAITLLEMIVAFIQAYVFTLLTSTFIGMVVQESH